MKIKKVFVIEDSIFFHKLWGKALEGKVELIWAISIEEAKVKFADNPDITAIVMDGCIIEGGALSKALNTESLVKEFHQIKPEVPIIAVSGNPEFREKLVQAGCSHECRKHSVPAKLCKILGL